MDIDSIITLLKEQGQIILQGAPGTGKTYATVELAVALCCPDYYQNNKNHADLKKKYDELVKNGRVAFTTFHQSMDYEDFVEGYKPATEEERKNDPNAQFVLRDGIFKKICEESKNNRKVYCLDLRTVFNTIKNNILQEIQNAGTKVYQLQGMQIQYDFQYRNGNFQVKSNNSPTYSNFNPNAKFKNKTIVDILVNGTINNKFDIDHARTNSNNLTLQGNYGHVWALVKKIGSLYNELIDNIISGNLQVLNEYNIKEDKSSKESETKENIKIEKADPYLLIIDEINRANISKVMGELITLLEKGKREGKEDARSAKLPYSQEEFTIPDNLYIIGTMNTADRSLGSIDYAIRRRFAFVTLEAEKNLVDSKCKDYFDAVKKLIEECRDDDFEVDEIMVGHSYFMPKKQDEWQRNIDYKIIPLLLEYFKDGVLIDKENKIFNDRNKTKKKQLKEYLENIVQKNDNLAQTEQQATIPE